MKKTINLPVNALNNLIITILEIIRTNYISQIENEFARSEMNVALTKLEDTVKILNDSNPDNKSQLSAIWSNPLADKDVLLALQVSFHDTINKMTDEKLKEGLNLLVEPILQSVEILFDTLPDNEIKLKTLWLNFIESPVVLQYGKDELILLIPHLIKNTMIANIIINLLQMLN